MKNIIKHELNKKHESYSAIYQTTDTLYLDEKFALNGEDVDEKKARLIKTLGHLMVDPKIEQEIAIGYFFHIATSLGNFYGLPYEEIETITRRGVKEDDLDNCVQFGFLELHTHEGTKIIAPTRKLSPFKK